MNATAAAALREGVCAPAGFSSGAAAAEIRGDGDVERLDIAVVYSALPCAGAGLFTRNTVRAAPVVFSQRMLDPGGALQAIVVNSGNANACTGAAGLRDAETMCRLAAEALQIDAGRVLVCSTGVIGRPLPMDRVAAGIRRAASSVSSRAGGAAARAIMTTDTRPKMATTAIEVNGRLVTVGGMAKGAGMIHPDMATLLAMITTDAPIGARAIQPLLRRIADDTFNTITVDGDTSTNDSLLLLANGAAGGPELSPGTPGFAEVEVAVHRVCEALAVAVVADAEGATKHFRVAVTGAVDTGQARMAARTVASSPLVKTAIHGSDPNWGRIVAALGRSGTRFALDECRVSVAGVVVFDGGVVAKVDLDALRTLLAGPRIDIVIDLGSGVGRGHAWGCDLGEGYVHINAAYTT